MTTKLLLVEDSLSIHTMVETTFAHEGFEVMVAGDALEGLHLVQTTPPDIILADASMPDIDGFQLCQRIRQSTSGRHVPVVLLTSGFAAYDKARGDRAGVTAHLAKPFEPHALLELVKQLVPTLPYPAYPSSSVATILPRPERQPFETTVAHVRESARSEPYTVARLAAEPTAPLALPHGDGAAATDGEGLNAMWETLSRPPTLEVVPQTAIAQQIPAEAAPAVVQAPLDVPQQGVSPSVTSTTLPQVLGEHVVQLLRETINTHITTTLTQLVPHILDTVREVVQAQMPALLEVLLQQEIDKLKQAAEQDIRDA
jgi:CheY-like chemotaxis protein